MFGRYRRRMEMSVETDRGTDRQTYMQAIMSVSVMHCIGQTIILVSAFPLFYIPR